MRRLRRVITWILAIIVILAVAGAGYGYSVERASWPQTSGTITAKGLHASVRVLRDAQGVPQVYASSDHDLMFAQGYVHAQDRFWEMDFRRHITAGRLSELFGKSQLQTDEFIRTLGWRRIAEAELRILKPETLALLQAYADGVNAWLAAHRDTKAMSLEYAILGLQVKGYEPERWTPADSVAWLKAMAWDLRGNLDEELDRTIAAAAVGVKRAEELYPAYPFDRNAPIVTSGGVRNYTTFEPAAPALVNTAQTMRDISALIDRMPAYFGKKVEGIGSNSWVVSGKHTTTGKPLLANDPHLSAMMPSIWTQVGLHCTAISTHCTFDVAGWSFSGLPGIVIGHNARVGWGFTNLGPDVADLVVEQVKGDTYFVDGKEIPITTVVDTIKVAGGRTVMWKSRSTQHGPLISDASSDYAKAAGQQGNAVALRWTALSPGRTADAIFALDRASDWKGFRDAARQFEVPAQNLLYADVDGNIGYQAPGRIPIRSNYDGRWPVPGWDAKYDWTGYIPFDALPYAYNPPEGFIVTANQAVVHTATYPYHLTDDWTYGYRAQRIRDVVSGWVQSGHKVSASDMQGLQMDTRNALADILVPALESATAKAAPLVRWRDAGASMAKDSSGAALFAALWRHLALDVFRDELPKAYAIDGQDRWFEVMRNLLADPTNAWWDDVRTKGSVETRDDMLKRAYDEAVAELTKRFGSDMSSWTWGDLHTLTLTNQSLGKSGIPVIERLFNRGPVGVNGSSSVVVATSWDLDKGYRVTWLPSMRQVLDLANWDASSWVNLTGESGHAYSPHYVDQFDAWVSGRTYPWPFTTAAVQEAAKDTLTLQPGA